MTGVGSQKSYLKNSSGPVSPENELRKAWKNMKDVMAGIKIKKNVDGRESVVNPRLQCKRGIEPSFTQRLKNLKK